MTGTDLYLAPKPKKLSPREGVFDTSGKLLIQLLGGDPQSLVAAAGKTGLGWEVTASPHAPNERVGLVIRLDRDSDVPADGYTLVIRPRGIEITASNPAGAFYGACTLVQIIRQRNESIPCLAIRDWPDFPARGVMLDISRDKVPTMETLYRLVDILAEWKINQLQLYTEHTFAYLAHPEVWKDASPMTGEEILALDACCRARFIELVPNQNSFGHMERWLKHDRYRHMAELPNGGETAWGYRDSPFSLCPTDRRCIPFLAGLYDELLPHFTSRLFNVGCDETVDLGYGRSKKACRERGVGRVYLDFLTQINRLVEERGRRMMFWGDIIFHHPELIPELPASAIALEWGYEDDHPFAEHGAKLRESGAPFYACPGTSAWCSLAGRTENALGNIASAAPNGLENGAIGFLNTTWGDMGHWDPLPVAFLGLLAGAMASWNAKSNLKDGLVENLSLHAFGDRSFRTGRAFYDLGNIYRVFGKQYFNCTVPWRMLFRPWGIDEAVEGLTANEFDVMERGLGEIESGIAGDEMTCPDADTVREELRFVIDILHVSAAAGRARLGGPGQARHKADLDRIKDAHRRVWLLRNRPGGLEDSIGRMV